MNGINRLRVVFLINIPLLAMAMEDVQLQPMGTSENSVVIEWVEKIKNGKIHTHSYLDTVEPDLRKKGISRKIAFNLFLDSACNYKIKRLFFEFFNFKSRCLSNEEHTYIYDDIIYDDIYKLDASNYECYKRLVSGCIADRLSGHGTSQLKIFLTIYREARGINQILVKGNEKKTVLDILEDQCAHLDKRSGFENKQEVIEVKTELINMVRDEGAKRAAELA